MALIEGGIARWPAQHAAVVGSSLGGYYATVVAQKHGWPAVVMNPAVDPARDLARHIGEQTAFHDPQDRFFFSAEFIDELLAMTPGKLHGIDKTLALIATGDEVLDWHEMVARYRGAKLHIVEGSDHALSDFDDHLPRLLQHLNLGG